MCIGFGMVVALNAQLISVRSELESDSIMIGDQVVFGLHVEADDNVDFVMPVLEDTLTGELEILREVSADTIRGNGRLTVEHTYLITGFDAGILDVPSQSVPFRSGTQWDTASSMPLRLSVYEPVVDTTQEIKPIKPPINTPVSFTELIPWIGLGLGIAVVATLLFLWFYYRKRNALPGTFLMKPREPAHVIAFRELDRLKEAKMWERGEVKRFYTKLTEIVRQYIERQYGIQAMEQTSEEIMTAFRRSNLEDELLDDILEEMLVEADLVKFAKEEPLPVDNQTNLNNAYIFVQKTFPMFYKVDPDNRTDGIIESEKKLEEAVDE